MERAVPTSKTSPKNVPSLEEAERVVSFIISGEAKLIASKVAQGTPMVESLRECLALTIAVVGATEQLYRPSDGRTPSSGSCWNDPPRPSWITSS